MTTFGAISLVCEKPVVNKIMAKIIFKFENGQYLSSYAHEDGGNASLTDNVDDATLFPKEFTRDELQDMLLSSDDYDGSPMWDASRYESIDASIVIK